RRSHWTPKGLPALEILASTAMSGRPRQGSTPLACTRSARPVLQAAAAARVDGVGQVTRAAVLLPRTDAPLVGRTRRLFQPVHEEQAEDSDLRPAQLVERFGVVHADLEVGPL